MTAKYERPGKRAYDSLRTIEITVGVSKFAEGSCEIRFGDTEVLCLASAENAVPRQLIGKDTGWVTAGQSTRPGSAPERSQRARTRGGPGGGAFEHHRPVARGLRSAWR